MSIGSSLKSFFRHFFFKYSSHKNNISKLSQQANQGSAAAQVELAHLYLTGTGIEKNESEALRLFRLSAEQGNLYAQNNLGYMYQTGQGVERNDEEAVRFYRLSANQGDAYGQANLGTMYLNGTGTKKTKAKRCGYCA